MGVEYYDFGPIGDQIGVIALPPSRKADDELVMGSIGFYGTAARAMRFRTMTGAQAIVQVGMAFGINPKRQKLGDVLVSKSLIPYDSRDIRPESRSCPQCQFETIKCVADFKQVTREPARPELIDLFDRHKNRKYDFGIHFGAMLSGSARIHSGLYRDTLVRGLPPGKDLIVGGEMEGVGLLAASVTWNDPIWCVVKGISDFADENRDSVIKESRPFACRNAGLFLFSALANDARVSR